MSVEMFNLPELLRKLPSPCPGDADPRLRELYEADQADRQGRELPPEAVDRDSEHQRTVMSLLADGQVRTAPDFYHAAMVFQHGSLPEHNHLSFELACRAADAGCRDARWLAAAALDRWLTRKGLPQRFGTQYFREGAEWEFYPVDPATTDEERLAWDVPPLALAHERLVAMNEELRA